MSTRFIVGLDLGQRQDYTAAACLEWGQRVGPQDWVRWVRAQEPVLWCRHLERAPLDTSYPEVVEWARSLVRELAGMGQTCLVVDATGVGQAVVDMLKKAELGCRVVPVMITGALDARYANGSYRVPKRDLVVGLQVMFENGEVEVAEGLAEAGTLVKELREMRVKIGLSGKETYESWREGAHDDLVLAVALACWWARTTRPAAFGGRRVLR